MADTRIEIRTGSDSDIPKIRVLYETLDALGIAFSPRILSAHRTTSRMIDEAKALYNNGFRVCIAAAGGAAHLPGMTASETEVPVIGLPVRTSSLDGQDSLYSIVQMPNGIPVGSVSAGAAEAAGILAAQIAFQDSQEIIGAIRKYRRLPGQEIPFRGNRVALVFAEEMEDPSALDTIGSLLGEFGLELSSWAIPSDDAESYERVVEELEDAGIRAVIAVGGWNAEAMTVRLPGILSMMTVLPVIGLPLCKGFAGNTGSGDLFGSFLELPAGKGGYPLAGMGINRPVNAVLFAVQICGLYDPEVMRKFRDYRLKMAEEVVLKDDRLRKNGVKEFGA
jgi:5-(carboxyamino)imidazole ribonucleotide mutase